MPLKKNRVAILPSRGIGDGLLMQIAACQFQERGSFCVTFHPALLELSSWFPGYTFESKVEDLSSFDLIIAQNDNSSRIDQLRNSCPGRLAIFYPTYCPKKHPPLSPLDQVFDPAQPMADNLCTALSNLLGEACTKQNGLTPPSHLKPKNQKQILLHPLSNEGQKNWSRKKWLQLQEALRKKGYTPLLVMSEKEQSVWGDGATAFKTLSDLASCVYESALVIGNDSLLGHLASNLGVPTVIIADDERRMRLWRPGWLSGTVLTPPRFTRRFKLLRSHWQSFISSRHVLRQALAWLSDDTNHSSSGP